MKPTKTSENFEQYKKLTKTLEQLNGLLIDKDVWIEEGVQVIGPVMIGKNVKILEPIEKLKNEIKNMGRVYNISLIVRWARDQKYYDDAWHGKIKLTGGGALTTQAIHHIDLLQYLIGMPMAVFAYKDRLKFVTETEDIMVAILKFENGAMATLETSTIVHPHNLESSITVLAENGTVKISGLSMDKIEYWYTPKCTIKNDIEVNPEQSVYGLSHSKLFANFIESLNLNCEPLTNGNEGIKTAKIIDAMYESTEKNTEILMKNL